MGTRDLAVDIVVNNHNYGRFLDECVRSALNQDYRHVHVIVVDDGSTDESREVLRGYAGQIDVLLKEQGGQASAVNAGFERSTGDVLIFLDADDMLEASAVSRVVREFAADDRVVKVQYRMQVVDSSGVPTGAYRPHMHTPLPSGDLRKAEVTFPYDLPWPGMSANAFRAGALRRIMPMPERSDGLATDWYLVHLVALLGHVRSLGDVLGSYRVHGSNMYAIQHPTLDLDHVRRAVICAAATTPHIERIADLADVSRPPGPILSVADLSQRLVLAKLAPEMHPIEDDRVVPLARDGVRASWRRFDVAWEMKILFAGWFVLMAVAPRRASRAIARPFLLPETRERINPLLRRFHKWNRSGG
jgi:hypothetical protein